MSLSPVLADSSLLPGERLTFSIRLDEGAPVEVSRNDCIRLDASKMRRTPQGGLRGLAAVSRVGVFAYRHTDGPKAGQVVREFRPPEEVFHPDSLVTLDQAPITDFHPVEGNGLISAANFSRLSKGQITNIRQDRDDHHVLADAVIQDAKVVSDVMDGRRSDFSPGYTCHMDWTPGVWNGQAYDVVQRHIRYNHLAILPRNRGRQGPSVALRFDAAIITETPMIVKLDGKDYDLSDETQRLAYEAAWKAKVEAATRRADQAEARADGLDTELRPLRDEKKAQARTSLETAARKVLGTEVKFDGLTDRQVREKAIGKDCAGKSDEYVSARFDQLVEAPPSTVTVATPDTALVAARQALEPGPQTSNTVNVPASWTNRWQEPLTASKDRK